MMDFTPGKPIRTYSRDGAWRDWSTEELVGSKLNFLKGWKCGAGVDSLCIDMDGNVWTAACRSKGQLGNVFTGFTSPDSWITCDRTVCSCGADLFIPKSRDDDASGLLRKHLSLTTQTEIRDDSQTMFDAMERTHAAGQKQVYWEIGRRCNFDCSYCWSWIHNNTEAHKTLDELMTATRNIEQNFTKGATVNFIISGGEPTANKDFLPWLRYLNSCGHHISLHSNGSRKPEYYEEIIQYGDLNLSVHFEYYDRERFVRVVDKVSAKKASMNNQGVGHLEVKFMMAPHDREEALSLEAELKSLEFFRDWCSWSIVPIRGGLHNKDMKPEDFRGDRDDQVMEGYTELDYELFGDRR